MSAIPGIARPIGRLGQQIELYNSPLERSRIHHAVFDFDGTLSLIRAGWQEVMVEQFVDILAGTSTRESRDELAHICRDFIARLTGKQTIYQMFQLVDEVARRGGTPSPALEYKAAYLDLLQDHITHRIAALQNGREHPERYRVRGSTTLLENLKHRSVTCYLASGTDHKYVVAETELLKLTAYFGGRIYGALEDHTAFSKKMLIERILAENRLRGAELAVFGDGYVEIENAKAVGGIAVGIASFEGDGGGWDPWKKNRLLQVGADVLVPDWREADLLLSYLFDGEAL